ncbi:hypothetical protein DCCM_4121 [Desulfocucumis palustris]|uniref:Uncharacterized protein n=1 Tax=Desulfocucumis palustris TaxID=1898651 RepID=A0A2L2XFR5_9FIRM|nr:hypothetical protein [Desulfocucumis palustris]GBF35000.1 hypothetical protein DCCM_4121 [Desulfocucumis palustris]
MKRFDLPGDYREPETIEDLHRPPGSPHPREIKSQQAQLKSGHDHGHGKDIKLPMSHKTKSQG